MSPLQYIPLAISILTLLAGGGLFSRVFSYSRKQAVHEYQQTETEKKVAENTRELAELQRALALTRQTMDHVEKKLDKLDLIESVHAKLEILARIAENVIPRPEAEAKFSDLGRRVEHVEEAVFHKE